jgi:hypothetical protein
MDSPNDQEHLSSLKFGHYGQSHPASESLSLSSLGFSSDLNNTPESQNTQNYAGYSLSSSLFDIPVTFSLSSPLFSFSDSESVYFDSDFDFELRRPQYPQPTLYSSQYLLTTAIEAERNKIHSGGFSRQWTIVSRYSQYAFS